jgi:hypothetical protein
MADKLVDMKKLVARYETNAFGALSKQDKANLAEDVEAALATEAGSIKMNAQPVEARYLPRLADIQQNIYSVLESESRKLADASVRRYHETLSAEEVKLLGVVTRSLCQLGDLERGLRQNDQLSSMSDEDLQRLAGEAFKQMITKLSEQSTMEEQINLSPQKSYTPSGTDYFQKHLF